MRTLKEINKDLELGKPLTQEEKTYLFNSMEKGIFGKLEFEK